MENHIGIQLKKIREQRNLSQEQVSELTGLHQQRISLIEKNGQVNYETIGLLASKLDAVFTIGHSKKCKVCGIDCENVFKVELTHRTGVDEEAVCGSCFASIKRHITKMKEVNG